MSDYKKITEQHFSNLFDIYGDDVKSLDWGSELGQKLRFQILTEPIREDRFTILDVGCGRGDLYEFLKSIGKEPQYKGVDLNHKIIRLAKEKYAKQKVQFDVQDILDDDFHGHYDYVVASGIFYLRFSDNETYFNKMIKKMMHLTDKALLFNMLSAYCTTKEPYEYYFYPEEIVRLLSSEGHKFNLRSDYKPNDFTIYLYK